MESSSSARKLHSICIFGGASYGNEACFTEAAHNLGRTLGGKCIHVVYGGGSLGLMGRAAASAYMKGVKVVGVIPKPLTESKITGATIGDEFRTMNMQDRITYMLNYADAFITLPGGFGTLEELFHVVLFLSVLKESVVATTPEELIEKLIAFVPEPDPTLANVVWTENFTVRKHKIDAFLSL
ncbi:hypothetical protein OROHE_017486 [Orobanche hederae]